MADPRVDQTVDPADELAHPVGDHPAWSESYYFYFADPKTEVAAFTRMGFRSNEGWADGLNVLYLGGRRIGFCYGRRSISAGDQDLTVGGLTLRRAEPFKRWELLYDGETQDIADGRILVTPRKDRPADWYRASPATMHITFSAVADPFYFWRGEHGHFEQIGSVGGTIEVAGDRFEVDGYGLRDKSWGPRTWANPAADGGSGGPGTGTPADAPSAPSDGTFSMWLTATFGPDLAYAVTVGRARDGSYRGGGFVLRDGNNLRLDDVTVDSDYEDGSPLHSATRIRGRLEDGSDFAADGAVVNMAPTKIAMPGGATLVNEGLTRWTLPDGRSGMGIAEYWVTARRSGE